MRLRLHVQRNGLPPVKLLWETDTALNPGLDNIVSNLLTAVNTVIPLEVAAWGLEDYVVELAGFEVLHFHPVSTVFKEDDEVVIRPLTEIEVKQRRLGGRTQISTSGRKLVDGTPFGKSFIRPAADRPTLLVPSRKRIRSANEEASTLQSQWSDATDEDQDYDVIPGPEPKRPRNSNATVRFISRNLESDDDKDDSSFHSGDLEDSEDQDSEDSEGDEDSMIQSDIAEVASSAEELSSGESSTDVPTAKSSSESSEDDSSEQLEVHSTKKVKPKLKGPVDDAQRQAPAKKGPATAPGTLPHQASRATLQRNLRKKLSRLLKAFQAEQLVGTTISLAEFKQYLADNGLIAEASKDAIRDSLRMHALVKSLGEPTTHEPIHNDSVETQDESSATLPGTLFTPKLSKKARRTAQEDFSAKQPTNDKIAAVQCPSPQAASRQPNTSIVHPNKLGLNTYGKSNKKWKKIRNKAALKTVFDEGDDPVMVDPVAEGASIAPETEHLEEPKVVPNIWQSKVVLSAIECELENVELPTPNFPFKQLNQSKKRKRSKKRRRTETFEGDDDPETTYTAPVHSEGNVQMQDQDLPPLLMDMSSLNPLTRPVLRGTVIAFKSFGVSEKYEPILLGYRTARVDHVDDSVANGPLLGLRLAFRDRPKPKYDPETGEKILGKFAMEETAEAEEEGFLDIMFGELLEAKVVGLPEPGDQQDLEPEKFDKLESAAARTDTLPGQDGLAANPNFPDELDYGEDIHGEEVIRDLDGASGELEKIPAGINEEVETDSNKGHASPQERDTREIHGEEAARGLDYASSEPEKGPVGTSKADTEADSNKDQTIPQGHNTEKACGEGVARGFDCASGKPEKGPVGTSKADTEADSNKDHAIPQGHVTEKIAFNHDQEEGPSNVFAEGKEVEGVVSEEGAVEEEGEVLLEPDNSDDDDYNPAEEDEDEEDEEDEDEEDEDEDENENGDEDELWEEQEEWRNNVKERMLVCLEEDLEKEQVSGLQGDLAEDAEETECTLQPEQPLDKGYVADESKIQSPSPFLSSPAAAVATFDPLSTAHQSVASDPSQSTEPECERPPPTAGEATEEPTSTPAEKASEPKESVDFDDDSDDLPSLDNILSQQWVKPERMRSEPVTSESPALPPLPDFSPFSVAAKTTNGERSIASRKRSRDPEDEGTLSQRQILQELARVQRGVKKAKAGAANRSGSVAASSKSSETTVGPHTRRERVQPKPPGMVEVIDLVSSPEPEKAPENTTTWRAVRVRRD